MKKILFCALVAIVSASASFGQKIHFSDSTNVWHYYMWDNADVPYYSYPFDYRYTGDTVYHSVTYKKLTTTGGATSFIREDTTAKKVYIVSFLNTAHLPTDTVERLLYNYNLKINDTFYYPYTIPHYVAGLDSVVINGVWHKVWDMLPINDSMTYGWQIEYYVVEGIGCLNSTVYPTNPFFFEVNTTTTCFSNNGLMPPLSRKVQGYFDNDRSCGLTFGLAVNSIIHSNKKATVVPNPANTAAKIILPESMSGRAVILNSLGQTIAEMPFNVSSEVLIGDKLNVRGLYYYRVFNSESVETYTGKFVY